MKINWFTVVAQVINFLVLVWLLKKFLYKPVLDAIDEREQKIVARLQDAKTKAEEAQKEQDEFVKKNKQFDTEKTSLMDKAIADTKIQKDALLEDARKEVDAIQVRQQKAVEDMQKNLKSSLAQKTQQEVFDISRKVLGDLASVSLEEQTVKLFINRLGALKDEGKKQFLDAFKSGSTSVLIRSAFKLQDEQQQEIKKAVEGILGKETEFQFDTVPEIISGIELTANGYKLAWSISAYLDSLQNSMSDIVKDNASADVKK